MLSIHVITIAGKTIKVPAGAGKKDPDGPTLDVASGKYPYKLKSGVALDPTIWSRSAPMKSGA